MVNVLIVDDSAFMRRSLATLLEADPEIKVVAFARDGQEALEMIKQHEPDLVTLDVEMPKMNGLVALEHIMRDNPLPVIMISSLTKEGAETTLKALELGALDYYAKQTSVTLKDDPTTNKELCSKIKILARRKAFMRLRHKSAQGARPATSTTPVAKRPVTPLATPPPAPSVRKATGASSLSKPVGSQTFDAVVIGVSTGGPPALQMILSKLPANFPVPILIAQHMPASFTGPFAERLNNQSAITVMEAQASQQIKAGVAYICPGGKHLRMEGKSGFLSAVVTDEPKEALYKPSANVLMETAGLALGRRVLAVMLTGMGNDGLDGTRVLKAQGGKAIAQSERTCVVYGMPKAIVDAELADEVIDLEDMADVIMAHFRR